MNSSCIERDAIVLEVGEASVRLQLHRSGACAHCEVAKHCNASDVRSEIVEVPRGQVPIEVREGMAVTLQMSERLGLWAVLLAMGIPGILILLITILLSNTGYSAGVQIVCSLIGFALYLCLLRLLRHRLSHTFTFVIRPK